MDREEMLFCVIWGLNFLISILCFLWKAKGNKATWRMRLVVMVLCPVIGPLFFACSHLVYRTIFRQEVDLEDVIFSKERIKTHLKADEERERNMVPIEEALAVSDTKNLRMLMMNVIRGDLKDSLESIMLALNSEDSETSHYAASVLRDELNQFRVHVRRLQGEIENETKEETECEELLLDYMLEILKKHIFTNIEQENFVNILKEAAQSLYEKDREKLIPERYEGLCQLLLDQNEYEETKKWCLRLKEQYPKVLASYTCELKLYFKQNDKERFFEVMESLKQTDIVIDSETLEVFRIFSQT